ncbi:MAG: hypothetical protein A2Y15_06850 [Clostridiales bacterium GWF2_36_10]|nr:MAG: hypothetical protein A2Y15_06850 [Clostridiales bacterium GWF2_36_10]HAN21930.1 DNA alkylation repair protein [Clostridiales bacterium]
MDIKNKLTELSEPDYKAFSLKFLPKDTILYGVRLAHLRKIAKEAVKKQDFSFLDEADYNIFEEKLLCGFMISYIKLPFNEKLELIKDFVTKIDSWSVCDSFCASFKFKENEKQQVFEFLQPYLKAHDEYKARFGIVMLLDHFINEEYIDRVLFLIRNVKAEGFYTKMASAWALSVCMVYFPQKTISLLEENILDTFVQNKAIQKSVESYRINEKIKNYIKTLKFGGKK